MGLGLLILTTALWFSDNNEFVSTVEQQRTEGYTWHYVGMTEPSGVPAITIQPDNGQEYILFKMKGDNNGNTYTNN